MGWTFLKCLLLSEDYGFVKTRMRGKPNLLTRVVLSEQTPVGPVQPD